ncbi:MAG: BrnT family toxin [Chloroflexi bacterium]|nr:BrnT family toxin [Chloroflexota bacterium]
MDLKFQWDDDKATLNLKNHQVSFDEARTIFDDPGAAIFYDEDHSIEENREVIVGHSARRRLLLVFFTQVAEDTIRIISARKATRTEQIDYEENANSQIPYRERNARRVSL